LTVAGAGLATGFPSPSIASLQDKKPALLGGPKAHPTTFPGWPVFDQTEDNGLSEVLKSKAWGRLNGKVVAEFEKEYANTLDAKHCLGVSSGTSALSTILGAMDIGPGDEVIMPVYTFVATYNVV